MRRHLRANHSLTIPLYFGIVITVLFASCSPRNNLNRITPQPSHKAPTANHPPTSTELLYTPTPFLNDITPLSITPPSSRTPEHTSPSPFNPVPASPTPAPCSPTLCTYEGHFLLQRPIASTVRDSVDPTYRYGSTQYQSRETHHGVEFVNSQGTPVLAAADGVVIVAGNDDKNNYADWLYFYGNLVILEHEFPEIQSPIYTVYAHLSTVTTEPGQHVIMGDQIGLVGFTGTAEGSHLHFEVRLGENDYASTRNPELWLRTHSGESGQPNGALAGKILDEFNNPIHIPNVVVERLSLDGQTILETIYVETYADSTVNGDDLWAENFTIGDLPAGIYRVSFVVRGLQIREVEVFSGMVTLMTFAAGE